MAEMDGISALLADALPLLTTIKSSPVNNDSWTDRPRISIQQNEESSLINLNTVELPHPLVSNF